MYRQAHDQDRGVNPKKKAFQRRIRKLRHRTTTENIIVKIETSKLLVSYARDMERGLNRTMRGTLREATFIRCSEICIHHYRKSKQQHLHFAMSQN